MTVAHTKGLHRGYADNVRVEWERRGKSGHSSIALLNAAKRPVAVLLGDYVPGETDADMDAAANLFCGAAELLAFADMVARYYSDHAPRSEEGMMAREARAAIAKATGEQPA